MRCVAYALLASVVVSAGALSAGPAAAGCYGDCYDDDDRSAPVTTYRSYRTEPRVTYYRSERRYYDNDDERPVYRTSHYDRPKYHTTYYERPSYRTSSYDDRPVYRTSSYDDGYYERPRYRKHYRRHHYSHRHHHYRHHNYYPTVRLGGAWMQHAGHPGYPGYAYWGGCHTAYIPYGWTWYRASSC